MNPTIILQISTSILVFLSILFAVFLLRVESDNKKGNLLLAMYLIIKAADASVLLWGNHIELPTTMDILRHDIGGFFQAPILFLFVLSILYADFRFRKVYLLFFLPFLLSTTLALLSYSLPELGLKLVIFDHLPVDFSVFFTYTLASLQNAGFILLTFWILARYKRILRQHYALSDHRTHRWLFQMHLISTLLFFAALLKNIHKLGEEPTYVTHLRIVVVLVMLIFVCWLVLTALHAPKLFRGIHSQLRLEAEERTGRGSTSEGDERSPHIEILQAHMHTAKPFLNPQLTIAELAKQVEMPVRELSHLINHHLGQDFHNFINEYRIETAKSLLEAPEQKQLSIKEILYQVGFSSKSSFNVSFKKATGLTPTQYRSMYCKSAA